MRVKYPATTTRPWQVKQRSGTILYRSCAPVRVAVRHAPATFTSHACCSGPDLMQDAGFGGRYDRAARR